MCKSVLFPAPDSPTMASRSPCATLKEKSSKSTRRPRPVTYSLRSFSTRKTSGATAHPLATPAPRETGFKSAASTGDNSISTCTTLKRERKEPSHRQEHDCYPGRKHVHPQCTARLLRVLVLRRLRRHMCVIGRLHSLQLQHPI